MYCVEREAGTILSKLAAIQYCHRVDVGVELPIRSPLIMNTLQGISRSQTVAGTRPRVRFPISWDMMIAEQDLIPAWGSGGKVLWLCRGMCYFFFAKLDEVCANGSGVVHLAHCLTRDDEEFFSGESCGVCNGVMPIMWRCDFAVIQGTRLKRAT